MKIFKAAQLYEADKITMQKQDISSEQLMERAAVEIFNWFHKKMQGAQVKIHLFCGIGNNGGDGLAVARHLWEHGYNIEVHVVSYSENRSEDFLKNLEKLKDRKIWPNFLQEETEMPTILQEEIIIDAIFGIGLNRPPASWVANIISFINNSGAFIVSVDVPSGLYLDRAPEEGSKAVLANYVLSIQAPKLIFFLPQTGLHVEQWEVLDIGMDRAFLQNEETDFQLVGKAEVLQWYKPRKRFTHKGDYGHSLLVGGSKGKIGAVILSAKSCLATGSGLVSATVPHCGYIPFQSAASEIMVNTDDNEEILEKISYESNPTAIGIGMGMGRAEKTRKAFKDLLNHFKGPMVIDADGLNILSEEASMLKLLGPKTVLTPHPGELKRLLGDWKDDFEKLEKAMAFSSKYDCILVLKDAHTIVLYNGKGYVNSTGNPGMATAGSGDVLTGMITGMISSGYEPLIAAVMAVYLHGRAGDLASMDCGYEALTAGLILDHIGKAYLDLLTRESVKKPEKDDSGNSQ